MNKGLLGYAQPKMIKRLVDGSLGAISVLSHYDEETLHTVPVYFEVDGIADEASQRTAFEVVARRLAIERYGYSERDALLKTLFERRTDGRYSIDWVEGAWLGWCAR
jgi:hypothetical protein